MFAQQVMVFGAVAAAALIINPTNGQTISPSTYRQFAACSETQVGGHWYNTFGEGRCPPGSRRAAPGLKVQGDVNARAMARTESSVRALGQMQQSMLSLGRALGQRAQEASDLRAETYLYHLQTSQDFEHNKLYQTDKFRFPTSGLVIRAGVGEPILTESDGFFSECFISRDGGNANQIGGHHHIVEPGELTCKLKSTDRAYSPLYINYINSTGSMSMGQSLELKDGIYRICYRNMGMNAMCIKNIPRDRVLETVGIVELQKTRREIAVYSGSFGDKVSITTRNSALSDSGKPKLFDMSLTKLITVDGIDLEVLGYNEREIVLRRK